MKYLIIGAGFSGAVLARELAEAGHIITVADKRQHVAGNAYDELHEDSETFYHVYGPHLFHTNNDEVFDWLSMFTEWTPYEHRVKARIGRADVTMPPNRETFEYFGGQKNDIIDTLFRPYSRTMWGMELEEMDPTIIARLPMRPDSEDDRYFTDKHQYLPKYGYTRLITRILKHPNIKVLLKCNVGKNGPALADYDHIFNCAPIDEWFDYEFGELPYRSMKFHHQTVKKTDILPVTTLNFTDGGKFTRVTEWNKLPDHDGGGKSLLTFEEPVPFVQSENYNGVPYSEQLERYYPVKDVTGENRARYKEYLKLVPENMTFIGRCGQYVYIDIHQAVNSSLQLAKKFLSDVPLE